MKRKWIYLLLLLAMVLPACKKILNIDRATDANPTPVTVEDFEQILNTAEICGTNFQLLRYITDDVKTTYRTLGESYMVKNDYPFYIWQMEPWQGRTDEMYGDCYKWIAQMNLVINQMPRALPTGQMNDRRALAIAQAKINRAYFYLMLVNIYAPAYQPATASADLAVPLVLQVNNQVSQARASVAQVYQRILADLQEALATPELSNTAIDIIHPSRVAALALLARAQLYMGNYAEAEKAASDVLGIKSTLLDYRNFKASTSSASKFLTLLEQRNSPEVLLARVKQVQVFTSGWFVSDELIALFDRTNDKRFVSSISVLNNVTEGDLYIFDKENDFSVQVFINNGIGVPEIMLIKAECLARANDVAGAVNLLNTLRAKRIVNYTNLSTSVNADQALQWVLDERRRELMFRGGIRLFDLKRLNLDARFKKNIERKIGTAHLVTLPAGSPNYVFPFNGATLNANPLLVQNPRVQLQ